MPKTWLPLEANPEILTAYSRKLGLPEGLCFHDVMSVESWAIEMIPQPVQAILLLFPISPASELERETTSPSRIPDVFYMNQTIGNACGTIAVLHTLANLIVGGGCEFDRESYVSRFLGSTQSLTASERGVWLENDSEIEMAHVAVESLGQTVAPGAEAEVDTHFIAFVLAAVGKTVVELDGRRSGPIIRGVVDSGSDFGLTVLDVIKREFMDRNPEDIRFSILALAPAE